MDNSTQVVMLVTFAVIAIVGLLLFIVVIAFVNVWLQARMSGAPVPFLQLLSMKLRRVPIRLIVENHRMAVKAGIPLSIGQLESHHLAGGDVGQVVHALIAAKNSQVELSFEQAAARDLVRRHGSSFKATATETARTFVRKA